MTGNEAAGGASSLRFGVVAPLRTDLPAWRDQVRCIADSGFSALLMPDVQPWQPAPGPTLAVAATLADLRARTWVYASPLRTPWRPLAYVCGPASFVETVSQALVQSGYPAERVKTERFGATGGT